ncbi:MAG: hypothetical protein HFE88_00675 [Acutalibacter sp.]|nr:hypothetical protein [Acutalibacter sp.]MCI8920382.1 hypothetical protein [Acutalibacter sp.]
MKKRFALFFLLFLLCLGGCAAQSASLCGCKTPEDRIQAVVSALYTGPDESQKEYYFDWLHSDGPESEGKAIAARLNHNKSRFHQEDFAEGALDAITRYFAEEDIYVECYLVPWNASLACTSVASDRQEDGSWRFTAPVTVIHQEGFTYEFTVIGTVSFNFEGKITDFQINDDGGLHNALAETNLLAAMPADGASTCT